MRPYAPAVLACLLILSRPADAAAVDESPEAAREVEELLELRAAEAEAIEEARAVHPLEDALLRLGPAHPLAARLRSSLGPRIGEWPTPRGPEARALHLAPKGELPFPVTSIAAKYDIPVEYNEAVAQYLAFFQGNGRRYYAKWLERSGRYVPLFREILRSYDVPEDLVYLAMIESGFSMHARSWAAAVGPWQFIEATGTRFGLRSDFWVDERRDPVKATHAAAKFLKRLHDAYGDWYLAWAGYNAGPGRVNRALRNYETADFWQLASTKDAFRKETRHYVPKLIAAAIIAKHPAHFGFDDVTLLPPLEWDTVEIPDATDLSVIARCAGVRVEEIEALNPELRRWATPPVFSGEKPYELRLPKGRRELFAENFAKVDPKSRFTYRGYVVQKGDTLGHIALMFDSSVQEMMRLNRISNARALRIGQELIVPVPPGTRARPNAQARSVTTRQRPQQSSAGGQHHVLADGETLGHVALRYGVSVEQLRRLNGIRDVRKVRVGTRLRIR